MPVYFIFIFFCKPSHVAAQPHYAFILLRASCTCYTQPILHVTSLTRKPGCCAYGSNNVTDNLHPPHIKKCGSGFSKVLMYQFGWLSCFPPVLSSYCWNPFLHFKGTFFSFNAAAFGAADNGSIAIKKKIFLVGFPQHTWDKNQQGSTFSRLSFCWCLYLDWNRCSKNKAHRQDNEGEKYPVRRSAICSAIVIWVWDRNFKNSFRKKCCLTGCLVSSAKCLYFVGIVFHPEQTADLMCLLQESKKKNTLKFPWILKALIESTIAKPIEC